MPAPPVLASTAEAAVAMHGEAGRLLALLAETSGRYAAGAFSATDRDALHAWASDIEPRLADMTAALREVRLRLRRAAGFRGPA
ncbi:hypothetical protein R1A27_31565 (plasmid) [Methylobacterium sp. NMS12]|uniref:hypothetical protein n=1 Tax=Methylobacterium sp. NMS12 TaxID=3079766 RepID=UPI003F88348F